MKNSKKKGQWFEEKVQKCLNSGQLWFDKADLKMGDFLIESKFTDDKSFRITEEIINKIWNDALDSNKLPKMIIGIPKNERELFILTCNIHVIKK